MTTRTSLEPPSSWSGVVEQLIEVGRLAVSGGLVLASGGNLSARLSRADRFMVTGAGAWLDRLTPRDIAVIDLEGVPIAGPRPSSEWRLHQRTYRIRPDVNAVIHLHPPYTVLVDALHEPIRRISLDQAHYVRSIGRVPFHPNGSDELADAAAEQAREHDCIVLAHHGSSTLGPDLAMAYRRVANLEGAALATYRCLVVGDHACRFPGIAGSAAARDQPGLTQLSLASRSAPQRPPR